MTAKLGIAAAALLTAALPAGAARAHHRAAPPLSFLRYNSYSVNQFLAQLNDSPKLVQRYANHFHVAPEQVIPYFRKNLVESYVPRTRRYTVWMARPDGRKYHRQQTFRAGTRVLALRNGEPVLKWACGNPLSNRLPDIQTKKVAGPRSKVLPRVQQRSRYVDVQTPFETPKERAEFPVVTPLFTAPPSTLMLASRTIMVPARASRFPWGALAPVLGINHGSRLGDMKGTEVPEPGAGALMLGGLVALSVVGRKARK